MKLTVVLLVCLVCWGQAGSTEYFFPSHRIAGVGMDRDALTAPLLQSRTDLMIQSQTFGIMRDPDALTGVRRITGRTLEAIFDDAAEESGFPKPVLEAIALLESWGDPNAESPTGPKGIMQISEATARDMGLKVVRVTKYKVTREKVAVKSKGKRKKIKFKTITRKEPYTVLVRDDRMKPSLAIPAAARYLASMERRFGGRDWAIFAYHCGAGCVATMRDLTSRAREIPDDEINVPRMFFSCSPTWNRELYLAIQQQMQRDYSPTYYFRIQRAMQLIDLYRRDPLAFSSLQAEYRNQFGTASRAPHRLSAWLTREDLIYRTDDDIRLNAGARLARSPQRSDYLGYVLRMPPQGATDSPQASPAALGALAYIAFETHRLYMDRVSFDQVFEPLQVTSMVEPEDSARRSGMKEAISHSSGQVFDIDTSRMTAGELECLRFVLNDLGWSGYLGFVEDGAHRLHVGCSPVSRDFFASVWQEAQEHLSAVSSAAAR